MSLNHLPLGLPPRMCDPVTAKGPLGGKDRPQAGNRCSTCGRSRRMPQEAGEPAQLSPRQAGVAPKTAKTLALKQIVLYV
jgi:hypothetical protein